MVLMKEGCHWGLGIEASKHFLFVAPDVRGTEPLLWPPAACHLHTGITDANPLEMQERSKLFSRRLWSQCFPTATHKTKTV